MARGDIKFYQFFLESFPLILLFFFALTGYSLSFKVFTINISFFRTRTLVPNLIYDWVLFLIAILIVSSIHFTVLAIIFDGGIKYSTLMSTAFFSFLIYPAIAKFFNQIYILGLKQKNVE